METSRKFEFYSCSRVTYEIRTAKQAASDFVLSVDVFTIVHISNTYVVGSEAV